MAGNILALPKRFPAVASGTSRAFPARMRGEATRPLIRMRAGDKKCGSSGELPQKASATREMIPPVIASVMDRDGLVVPVAGLRAGSHMGRGRGLAGLDPVRRGRRLPVMARRWRVVVPGIVVMHTACPQEEEPGEQDQGQDMQEPDKSEIWTHRHSLVPFRIAPRRRNERVRGHKKRDGPEGPSLISGWCGDYFFTSVKSASTTSSLLLPWAAPAPGLAPAPGCCWAPPLGACCW